MLYRSDRFPPQLYVHFIVNKNHMQYLKLYVHGFSPKMTFFKNENFNGHLPT